MQEEYGIKLKILTESLQQSVNKAKNIVSQFTSKIKADFEEAKKPIELDISGKKFNAQISYIEDKIDLLKAKLERKDIKLGDFFKTQADIERLTNRLNDLKNKEKEVGNEAENTKEKMSGISISATQTNNTIVNGFEKSWKTIKRFAFSLLSIRGIYGLVRKASSAYLSQYTQLANQMQKTWASLGALMAPILEKIVKGIRIAAAYVSYFVKALTGKDLIGKAVKKVNAYNKSLGGTAKAAKAVNKELTTLDEVTNLSFDDASTQGIEDVGAAFDDFSDIKLDPKITETLDRWAEAAKKLWDRLKPVRDMLGKIVNWAIDHPDAVLTILGGAALVSTLKKLTGTSGVGVFASQLSTLAKIGIVVAGVDLIYNAVTGRNLINDLKEIVTGLIDISNQTEDNKKQAKSAKEESKKFADGLDGLIQNYGIGSKEIKNYADNTNRLLHSQKNMLGSVGETTKAFNANSKQSKNNRKAMSDQTDAIMYQTDNFYKLYKLGALDNDQRKKGAKLVKEQKKQFEKLAKEYWFDEQLSQKFTDSAKKLDDQLYEMTMTDYACEIGVETNKGEQKAYELEQKILNLVKKPFTAKTDVDTTNSKKKTGDLVTQIQDILTKRPFVAKTDVDDKTAESKTKTLGTSLSNLAKTFTAKFKIDVGTQDAKNKIRNFFTSTNNLFKKGSALGGVVKAMNTGVLNALINAIPGYDVGTNYVPNDQLAMVHKGEAIVPKKFNNEQFFNNNNEETNALLVEVNQNLIELRNRPNVLEVNGRELAQATYSDFQSEGSRLNQSMTIKRSGN